MSEPEDAIQDLMRRYGFEEAEARIYHHLLQARHLFRELEKTTSPTGAAFYHTHLFPPFLALQNELVHRA